MINANELRIGNLVLADITKAGHPEICRVIGMPYVGSVSVESWSNDLAWCKTMTDFVDPIPITDELLLKLGFNQIESKPDRALHILPAESVNEFCVVCLEVYRNEATNQRYFWHISDDDNNTRYVDYVHQLQNLFFALAQKELQFAGTEKIDCLYTAPPKNIHT